MIIKLKPFLLFRFLFCIKSFLQRKGQGVGVREFPDYGKGVQGTEGKEWKEGGKEMSWCPMGRSG